MDIDKAIIITCICVAFLTVGLVVLQLDAVSRKILSPLRLYIKRRQEQLYKLDQAIADSIFYIRTHVNEGNNFEAKVEKKVTDVFEKDDDGGIQRLVDDIVNDSVTGALPCPTIVGISKDLSIAHVQWYIHLAFPQLEDTKAPSWDMPSRFNRRVQVPLIPFCEKLSAAFDEKTQKNAFCFIADASSSSVSHFLSQVIIQSKSHLQLPIVQEPAWMSILSLLIRKKALEEDVNANTEKIPQSKTEIGEKILFSLCRMEAHRLAKLGLVGEYNTIAFTLPGPSSTAPLVPLLQKMFPSERFVFAYDDCIPSVQRAVNALSTSVRAQFAQHRAELPVTAMPRVITSSIPIIPLLHTIDTLPDALAGLSNCMAGIVEAWMSSVHTIITLQEDESQNSFVPFVCRMEFLMKNQNYDDKDNHNQDLVKMLQYITGSRSIAMDENLLDAVQSVLADLQTQEEQNLNNEKNTLSNEMKVAIEECVSSLKMISNFK